MSRDGGTDARGRVSGTFYLEEDLICDGLPRGTAVWGGSHANAVAVRPVAADGVWKPIFVFIITVVISFWCLEGRGRSREVLDWVTVSLESGLLIWVITNAVQRCLVPTEA